MDSSLSSKEHLPSRLMQAAGEIKHGQGNRIGAPYWWGEVCAQAAAELNRRADEPAAAPMKMHVDYEWQRQRLDRHGPAEECAAGGPSHTKSTDCIWEDCDQAAIYCAGHAREFAVPTEPPLDARYCPFNHKPCEPIDLAEETSETKSETVMSKVRQHFDEQRDRDGYHSELERLEFAPPADPGPAEQWSEPAKHCQNGGDVCLAGNKDGICCPDDSCDIDDGMTSRDPRRAATETSGARDE